MESGNRYESEIDVKNLLFYIMYRWRPILLAAILLCMLFSVIGIIRKTSASSTDEPKEVREYKLALENYEMEIDNYKKDMLASQKQLEQQETYMEKSVLMGIDPYSKPVASVDIFVKLDETEWAALPDNINIDPTDSLIKLYSSDLSSYLDWNPIEELTGSEELYLKEILDSSSDNNSNTFKISVTYSNADTAQQILDIVVGQIMEKYHKLAANTNKHTISVVNQSLTYVIDNSLAEQQKDNEDALADYEQTIFDCRLALENLTDSRPKEPKSAIFSFIKYPAIGFLLGIFLWAVFYGMAYLLGGRLHMDDELRVRYGYPLLGRFPRPERTGFTHNIDLFLQKLEGTSGQLGKDETYRYISTNIRNMVGKGKKLLVTGTIDVSRLQEFRTAIAPYLDDVTLESAGNISLRADALEALAECHALIIVEERDKSMVTEIANEYECIRALNKSVIGYVLL